MKAANFESVAEARRATDKKLSFFHSMQQASKSHSSGQQKRQMPAEVGKGQHKTRNK